MEGLKVEGLQRLSRERELFAPWSRSRLSGMRCEIAGSSGPDTGDRNALRVEAPHRVLAQIIGARERFAAPDRPVHRRDIERERLLDLVEEVERVAALPVHLVDEGDDRNVAQAADLEELARARLDAARRVDHHDGGIDRRERAVGVLGEILMARRVEKVEDAAAIFEGHHRGHDRDAALALDPHPIGAGLDAVALRLHLARELDRAAEQAEASRSRWSCPHRGGR